MATASFTLPALPDNAIWWANNAGWQNYWANADLQVTIDNATTSAAGVVKMAAIAAYNVPATDSQGFNNFQIGGVDYTCPDQTNFNQLKTAFLALQTDHQALRAALATAGIISHT